MSEKDLRALFCTNLVDMDARSLQAHGGVVVAVVAQHADQRFAEPAPVDTPAAGADASECED